MKKISAGDTFEFKGVALKTGDHVLFFDPLIELPHIEACFTNVDENGNMNVFSTLLVPFHHDGKFKESEVFSLKVVKPAIEAFTFQSRNERLFYGQKAVTFINNLLVECQLIGAFDGIVCGWCKGTNNFVFGGSTYFTPVWQIKEK